LAETIQSTAVSDTVAASLTSTNASATRHFTGGWTVNSAGLGAAPLGEGRPERLSLVTMTREGYLRVYDTPVAIDGAADCTALSQWPEYGHDAFNSGNYETDAERPYPLREFAAGEPAENGSVELTFLATGDDRLCGSADRYEVRRLDGSPAQPDWLAAEEIEFEGDAPGAAGDQQSLTVGPLPNGQSTLLVRAFDEAGNGSAIAAVPVLVADPADPGDDPDGGGNGGSSDVAAGAGGGCVLADGERPFDPAWLLLLIGAVAAPRWLRRRLRRSGVPGVAAREYR